MRRAAKIDANQNEIVDYLRSRGAYVVLTHQLKNAFDCIVFHSGRTFVVEIKDGSKRPSQRRLTAGELECKYQIELRDCKYHVIESIDDAFKLISNL